MLQLLLLCTWHTKMGKEVIFLLNTFQILQVINYTITINGIQEQMKRVLVKEMFRCWYNSSVYKLLN